MIDDDGYQLGLHAPKVGCWGCVEAFLGDVEHALSEDGDGGYCQHPEGPRALAAFRAWAEGARIDHLGPPAVAS